MHRFNVKCAKPSFVSLGESKNIAESKDLVIKHYETETGEVVSGVDRIVVTTSLMVNHEAELGKYHYILEKQ